MQAGLQGLHKQTVYEARGSKGERDEVAHSPPNRGSPKMRSIFGVVNRGSPKMRSILGVVNRGRAMTLYTYRHCEELLKAMTKQSQGFKHTLIFSENAFLLLVVDIVSEEPNLNRRERLSSG
jgi:hypothetical protein